MAALLHLWELRVGQRVHERDDVFDLGIREIQVPHILLVHVLRDFGRRPISRGHSAQSVEPVETEEQVAE